MKKFVIALFILLLAVPAYSAEQLKIGYVDLQKALNDSEPGKRAKADIENYIKSKQDLINEKIKQRDEIKNELEAQANILTPEAKKEKEAAIDKIEKDVKEMYAASNDEVQKLQRQKEVKILKDLEGVIEKVGKDEKFTIILTADVVLYADDERVDLTTRIVEIYNAKDAGQPGHEPAADKPKPKKPSKTDKKK